jgi:hypothetical protein
MPAKSLKERILDADVRASTYLGDYNELVERGYPESGPKAQTLFRKAQFWLDRHTLLTNQGDKPAPKE